MPSVRSHGAQLVFVLSALLAACSGSRGHDLLEGSYAFTETEVISDLCGLLPADGLWDGTMVRAGDYVSIEYGFAEIDLTGYYRYALEEFYADGTAEAVPLTLGNGQSCTVDQIQIHLDAITRSPAEFDGAMTVQTFARGQEACECQLSVTYRAVRQ